ncbi:MAG: 6,7-dimethyl-8-ribityllumazine synthase [Pseudomonadota bacterium]
MSADNRIEGTLDASQLRVAIIAARFNELVVDRLVSGAIGSLVRHGAGKDQITEIHVPGAYEIPLAARRAAESGRYDIIVALGAVIRGATPHFDYVCGECAAGLSRVMENTGVPVGFGVLTVDTIDQALERAGSKAGNKGEEAALAAVELASVLRQLEG